MPVDNLHQHCQQGIPDMDISNTFLGCLLKHIFEVDNNSGKNRFFYGIGWKDKLQQTKPASNTLSTLDVTASTCVTVNLRPQQLSQQQDRGNMNMEKCESCDRVSSSQVMLNKGEPTGQAQHIGNLTAMLLEQQISATLPQREIMLFAGNPLDFSAFMQTFKHLVENKGQVTQTGYIA